MHAEAGPPRAAQKRTSRACEPDSVMMVPASTSATVPAASWVAANTLCADLQFYSMQQVVCRLGGAIPAAHFDPYQGVST